MAQTAVDLSNAAGDYPLANTPATKMLQEALDRASADKGWSQRAVAKLLNYKTSVVLSHMALGRVPIPIDRALDFARLLKIPPGDFLLAVLQQRHPEIDFDRVLSLAGRKPPKEAPASAVVAELESLAGTSMDDLPQGTVNVLRDAVADRNAQRRWMQMGEVSVVEKIRSHHPEGLTNDQRARLLDFIAKL